MPCSKHGKRSSFIPLTKPKIREHFRQACCIMTLPDRQKAAQTAATIFAKQAFFKSCHHVASYLPIRNEFDAMPLMEELWRAKKTCYLPVIATDQEKTLHFVRYQHGDALHKNRYGVLEPIKHLAAISPAHLDIVITPLIAFDVQGHRLGTGGGFYDKTFSFLQQTRPRKPLMIGLGYAIQQARSLPVDPWDVLLDGIVTEQQFIACLTIKI